MRYKDYRRKTIALSPEVRAKYDTIGAQYALIADEIKARRDAGITQKELAEKMGTAQANISRFERGSYDPSLTFLQCFFKKRKLPTAVGSFQEREKSIKLLGVDVLVFDALMRA